MKTILGIIVGTMAASTIGLWYWNSNAEVAPEFRTLPSERGDLLIAVTATGTVEPVEVIDVGAQIVGRIQSFGPDPKMKTKTIDYGSNVKKGDILAQLDDSTYLVEMQKAQANLTLAQAELASEQAQFQQAERDWQRASALRQKTAISASEYDQAVAQYETAKANLAVGRARVEQAEIAKREAEINLGYTTIASPIDGVVIDRRVNVGQTVIASLNAPSLFLLAKDLSRMQVWAAVNEADIGDVRVGQQVTFSVDAYRDETFSGAVSQIRLNASMLHNVVTYGVVVDIDNTAGKLLPYMTANLQFEVARRADALLVPNQALRWRPTWNQITPAARAELQTGTGRDRAVNDEVELERPVVWVRATDGLARPVIVQTGLSDGTVTEIVAGQLQDDTEVIISAARARQPDFVSSFIDRVTKKKEAK